MKKFGVKFINKLAPQILSTITVKNPSFLLFTESSIPSLLIVAAKGKFTFKLYQNPTSKVNLFV